LAARTWRLALRAGPMLRLAHFLAKHAAFL